MFSLCEIEKIRRTGVKKTFAFSVRECSNVIASDIRFAFSRSVWKGLDTASVNSNKNASSHFNILNEPWPTGHNGASGPCSHIAFFLHDIALVGICRWHCRLCLLTVVSGSIPGPI